jgi:hypothetical protein
MWKNTWNCFRGKKTASWSHLLEKADAMSHHLTLKRVLINLRRLSGKQGRINKSTNGDASIMKYLSKKSITQSMVPRRRK